MTGLRVGALVGRARARHAGLALRPARPGARSSTPAALAARGRPATPPSGVLALADVPTPRGLVRLSEPATADDYARVLYAALREADALALTDGARRAAATARASAPR